MALVGKIVSGGQTGADRAALDWAILHQVTHGGWCPRGRLSEDGPIDRRYQLTETPSSSVVQRTEWNVRDSDGTVIFSMHPVLSGGSEQTAWFAAEQGKPLLHISKFGGPSAPAKALLDFIRKHDIKVLNVAGPRASEASGIYEYTMEVLTDADHSSRKGDI